ncbi:MAG: hypothetical protein E5X21_02225 [Mesorhizobium sp.]|uniref:hypothetical protein n=1 Tax=unclassified Mesorhizobium TaxID=325217 RepID=UPI000FE7D452|nr:MULTISPECIES: hypothetical protein [unclassified Mesorhizobium]RWG40077.1 MAG: hypothetical protein EOQ59_09375 [Mesorhizobium sp.]RWG50333.1 MAG: hypothetical protein EOQ63_09780 [Mesorhizobium sp.]RWG71527.1 MAG: hypothetical protein EOQ66_11800 [Mesorhizobium sp.]TIM79976.1 MAG: hypothetical protein E5Y41_00390 [Mesorhizobium sp.]TIN56791.1 MAG: hypothetical protein E5Y24_07965 [Mesorhizobium sp.]
MLNLQHGNQSENRSLSQIVAYTNPSLRPDLPYAGKKVSITSLSAASSAKGRKRRFAERL